MSIKRGNSVQSCLMRAKVLRHDQDIELTELFACYQNYKITWGKEQLTKAIDLFRECGADGWVTRTEKALAELS